MLSVGERGSLLLCVCRGAAVAGRAVAAATTFLGSDGAAEGAVADGNVPGAANSALAGTSTGEDDRGSGAGTTTASRVFDEGPGRA